MSTVNDSDLCTIAVQLSDSAAYTLILASEAVIFLLAAVLNTLVIGLIIGCPFAHLNTRILLVNLFFNLALIGQSHRYQVVFKFSSFQDSYSHDKIVLVSTYRCPCNWIELENFILQT